MTRLLIALTLCLSTLSLADLGVVKVNDVSFLATGPAGLKIRGETKTLEVKNEGDVVVIKVALDSVDTGIGLRNQHMKEKYLQTGTFPTAELKVARSMLKEGPGQTGTALFSVHGVSKEVAVTYDVVKAGDGLEVKGHFDINIKSHNIDVPSYLGVTVKPEVKVTAAFVVKP
ncbi:MAG: YceI family protein [Archangium sp.]|nr:YceI family protein [Archangium sp.]MDP3156453.1 YceI family protein [Archangium sp.]MDP3573101.1 YceI family protein [Archangium sp.]